ncbi:hypothetical protein [Fulvivirga ligni]|uniref:hypothetical protein n=1 Tax=Fulvivirga ligni TaxID=2904246 RepID=UPI001F2A473E|nr:hypothetical protein [Fulvivirga ligni]UII21060.1 hypothetical protein LVD16_24760 [Fulvivirga ligni]
MKTKLLILTSLCLLMVIGCGDDDNAEVDILMNGKWVLNSGSRSEELIFSRDRTFVLNLQIPLEYNPYELLSSQLSGHWMLENDEITYSSVTILYDLNDGELILTSEPPGDHGILLTDLDLGTVVDHRTEVNENHIASITSNELVLEREGKTFTYTKTTR